jgi:hypothetical protein
VPVLQIWLAHPGSEFAAVLRRERADITNGQREQRQRRNPAEVLRAMWWNTHSLHEIARPKSEMW